MMRVWGGVCLSEMEPQENPLVTNKKLRQMYLAMVEARILDEHIAKLQRSGKARQRLDSTHGQEACCVSTAIELVAGDLVSDSQDGVVMDHILGAEAGVVLKRLSGLISREKTVVAGTRQLPWIEDMDDRLRLALGAALAFKSLKQTSLVVAYVPRREASGGRWRRLLTLSAKLELPIIFVVLPLVAGKKKAVAAGSVSGKARRCGIPGIPVDSSDAVALYRVAQESIGRIRAGGGAVLIDCVSYPVDGRVVDPVEQMKSFMIGKKVGTSAWIEHAGDSFRERISVKKKQGRKK
jgi:TPP-dependent pyruvate/acetoin dehydrogenase alpha subunit